ncbi:MAG: hypothetical protein JSV68_00330 [Anaerolineaceae bacterium]|nr:MAG: hypothetical protein JSV68_00330 [Anaerolineaceae bacterium]
MTDVMGRPLQTYNDWFWRFFSKSEVHPIAVAYFIEHKDNRVLHLARLNNQENDYGPSHNSSYCCGPGGGGAGEED